MLANPTPEISFLYELIQKPLLPPYLKGTSTPRNVHKNLQDFLLLHRILLFLYAFMGGLCFEAISCLSSTAENKFWKFVRQA